MTEQQLKKLEEKGFSIDEMSQRLGAIHLANVIAETLMIEYEEWLKPFGLANSFRKELTDARKFQKTATTKITEVIPEAGVRHLMKDSLKGKEIIESYSELIKKQFFTYKPRFRAEKGCKYYYKNEDMVICEAIEENDRIDKDRYEKLNYYLSIEEAL